jgi:eukaryotic-like serine/threonine-protein kinase
VLDFGIAKAKSLAGSAQATMTMANSMMGSPAYMAPEQIRDASRVDARSDVWSLGVTLYELLTGAPAFLADTVNGMLLAIAMEPVPPLRSRRPDAPAELEAVVSRCLTKDPGERVQSMAGLASQLVAFSPASAPLVERIVRAASTKQATTGSQPGTQSSPSQTAVLSADEIAAAFDSAARGKTAGAWSETTPPEKRRSKLLLIGLGAAGIVLALIAVLIVVSVKSNNVETAAAASASAAAAQPAAQQPSAAPMPAQPEAVHSAIAEPEAPPADTYEPPREPPSPVVEPEQPLVRHRATPKKQTSAKKPAAGKGASSEPAPAAADPFSGRH